MILPFFKNKKGFTIIETLIAIAIIMTAIAGPMTASQKGLNTAIAAKDQFVARYLAQDAIEYFYYLRDWNIMNGNDWLDSIPNNKCNPSAGCTIDSYANDFDAIPPGQIDNRIKLYKTPSGYFTHVSAGNELTQFTRRVDLNIIDPSREVIVTTIVTWQSGKNTNKVEISKNVFNR